MNLNFLASQAGIVLAAAGMIAGIVTSGTSPAQALLEKATTAASSFDLAAQSSDRPIVKDNEDNKDDEDDGDDDAIKSLPQEISNAVFKDVAEKSGVSASQLRIVKVERQTWSDGCLGLGGTDTMCTQSMIPGWRVVVANGERRWVYRTNQAGSLVKWDEVATRTLSSDTTTQITRRQEVTTTRTTQSSQAVTGSNSQSSQTMTGISGSQSRASQSSQAVTGSNSQSSQAMMGISGSQSRATQANQSAGSTQTSQGMNTQTQQQTRISRSTARLNFTDVSQNYWARDFIAELAGRGILTGFPDGKFYPNEQVTRAQFAALVATVFKKPKVRNLISFSDVSSRYWAYEGVKDAYEMGFLDVDSRKNFNPDQGMTRLQILTALAKGLNYSVSTSTEKVLQFYSDASAIPSSARTLVAAATERGIVANYPNVRTCNPNQVATRAEVTAFVHQAMVSQGEAAAISSPYVAGTTETRAVEAGTEREVREGRESERNKPRRQQCNQGIGNGAEGCDPGNSSPRGGSNDEGGRTPGNRPK